METIVERPGALDVHKAQVTACVRMPGEGRAREQHIAEFPTTVAGLLTLRDWLAAHGVTQVTMEATGVYWKPVWAVLEDDFELLLVNARHVKHVPGRKTDVSDAAWLCQLAEAGLLRAGFVPPKAIRALRNLTRYRKTQIQERAREANRLHKALEDTGIKLDCVATDLLGKSGRAMLDAPVAGTTDPQVLADLARGRLRAKLPALREALEGRFDHLHAVWIGAILNHLDFLDEQIAQLTESIAEQIAPFEAAVELLCTIPEFNGPAPKPSSPRSASTVGVPLEEAALSATRSKGTYLAAQYARLRPRRGHKKALGAVKDSIIVAAWHMLSTGELYNDLGGEYFQRRDPAKTTKRLIAELERLGHTVTLEQADRVGPKRIFLSGVWRSTSLHLRGRLHRERGHALLGERLGDLGVRQRLQEADEDRALAQLPELLARRRRDLRHHVGLPGVADLGPGIGEQLIRQQRAGARAGLDGHADVLTHKSLHDLGNEGHAALVLGQSP